MKTCVVLALFLMAGFSLGGIQKRIMYGRGCKPEEIKQFVFLKTDGKCSGSVIGDGTWVVTAKHCDAAGIPFTIKGPTIDGVSGWTEISDKKIPHPSADIMLIKMKVQKTAIQLATIEECDKIMNQLDSSQHVKMVLVARDTDAEDTTGLDSVLCGEINVHNCEQRSEGPCFSGVEENCLSCEGDSGGGYIYKSGNNYKLYGVFWGNAWTALPSAAIACEDEIREWIDKTMNP